MATTVRVDNVDLDADTVMPTQVRVIPPDPVVYPGPGTGKVVVQPLTPPVIELSWGPDIAPREVVAALKAARGRRLVHVLSWTNEDETGIYHANVMIPEIGYGQGPHQQGVDPFTLRCEVINPMPGLVTAELYVPGVLTTGDGKAKWKTPAGGRILKVGGYIGTLGTGTGQTRVQVSNGDTDYLSTRGDFVVASGTGLMENAVLAASPTFNRSETIELDIDTIPGNSDGADLQVWLTCLLFRV